MWLRRFLWVAGFLSVSALVGGEARRNETVGTLDFFGLRRLNEVEIRAKLNIKEGDAFQRTDTKSIVAELEKIPGVKKATLSPITSDGSGKLNVFVGIQEEGSLGFAFREQPSGPQRLPDAMTQVYRDFIAALGPAVRSGVDREDHAQGHAINRDAGLRKAQDAAIAMLARNSAVVQDVLKSSAHADDRRAAAWLLGYAPDKKSITADLVDAARDPDSTVRNNATRALGAIADLAAAQPKLGIRIDPTIFLDMLGSVTWTDRNKASFLLDGMTKTRPPELLRILRTRALPDLNDIARWKSDGHAFPAIRILGRIAGWSDERTFRALRESGVETIVAAAAKAK